MYEDPLDPLENSGHAADEQLDRLLHDARWPEPEPARIERLSRRWARLSPVRRPATWPAYAAAAGLLLALGIAAWLHRGQPGAGHATVEDRPTVTDLPSPTVARTLLPARTRPPAPQPMPATEPPRAPVVESRPATIYEQLVLLTASRRHTQAMPPLATTEEPSPLHQALSQLTADPRADVDRLAAPLLAQRARHEAELLNVIRDTTGATQQAAIRLLGHIGTPRALPLLHSLLGPGDTHASAARALARLAEPAELARLAAAEADRTLQHTLFAAFARRGGPDAVPQFLAFVADRRTGPAALGALDDVLDLPPEAIERLFDHLGSPQYSLRLAAARVLGRLDGREISERLAAMVVHNVNQREALLALLWIPGGDASKFLTQAEHDPYLRAAIGAARSQLQALN